MGLADEQNMLEIARAVKAILFRPLQVDIKAGDQARSRDLMTCAVSWKYLIAAPTPASVAATLGN